MTPSRSTADSESEIRDIQLLLESNLNFHSFRPELEAGFVNYIRDRAQRLSRNSLWLTLIVYPAVCLLFWWQVARTSTPAYRDGNLTVLGGLLLAEGLLLAFVMLIPYLPCPDRYYRLYASISSGGTVAVILYATSAFPDPYFNVFISYWVIMTTVTVYAMAGLVTLHTTYACIIGVVVALAAIIWQGLWLDLGYFLVYGVTANGMGILLSFLLQSSDRVTFLQAHLLALEKARLDEYAAEVERLSRQDALTGLANRRYFDETSRREWGIAWRRGDSVAIIFLDVDFFKPFNDTYGHPAGDDVLRQVSQAIAGAVWRPSDLAARYGGEEFVVLLPDTDLAGASEIASRIELAVAALAIPHGTSRVADRITVSMGVAAIIPSTDNSCNALIASADQAAYAAKAAGRNRIIKAS